MLHNYATSGFEICFAHSTSSAGAPNQNTSPRDITERPHAPSGVAAFMSAHSKNPYVTASMDFPSGKGVVRGAQGAAAGICLGLESCVKKFKSYFMFQDYSAVGVTRLGFVTVSQPDVVTSHHSFQNGATSVFEMCFSPSTKGAKPKDASNPE